jgi:hypothetical protein
VQGGQVEGRVALTVRRARLGPVQDEELGGHDAAGKNGLHQKKKCRKIFEYRQTQPL